MTALRYLIIAIVLLLANYAPVEACACPGSITDMLPSAQIVGPEFRVTDEGSRTLQELAATFQDPRDAEIRLDAWGWQENAYRTYEQGSESIQISVHRFSSDHGAILALPYFVETRAGAFDLREVPQQPILLGSSIRTTPRVITGLRGERSEYTMYEQVGAILFRVSITAPVQVPDPDAEAGLAFGTTSLMTAIHRSLGLV